MLGMRIEKITDNEHDFALTMDLPNQKPGTCIQTFVNRPQVIGYLRTLVSALDGEFSLVTREQWAKVIRQIDIVESKFADLMLGAQIKKDGEFYHLQPSRLKQELEESQVIIQALRDQAHTYRDMYQQAKANAEMSERQQNLIAEQNRRIAKLEAEVKHWKGNHAEMVRQKRILADRPDLQDRAKRMQELIEANGQLREDVADRDWVIDCLREDRAVLLNKNNQQADVIADLRKQQTDLSQEIGRVRQVNASQAANIRYHQEQVELLEREVAKQKDHITEVRNQSTEMVHHNSRLKQERDDLRAHMEKELAIKDGSIKMLQNQIRDLQSERAQLKEQIKARENTKVYPKQVTFLVPVRDSGAASGQSIFRVDIVGTNSSVDALPVLVKWMKVSMIDQMVIWPVDVYGCNEVGKSLDQLPHVDHDYCVVLKYEGA